MDFDPYEKWLDIPPGLRPPSGRALLGIAETETDEGRIQQAAMGRYEQIRPYAASPQKEVADSAHRMLGEIARALTATLCEGAATTSEPGEELPPQRPDFPAMIRKHFPEKAFAQGYRERQIGRAIAVFGHLLQGDREYVIAFEGGLHATEMIMLTDRACYHCTDRLMRSFCYDDIARAVASKSNQAWEVNVDVGDRPRHQILLSEMVSKRALQGLFREIIDSAPDRAGEQPFVATVRSDSDATVRPKTPDKQPARTVEPSATQCPRCNRKYVVPPDAAGKQALCKSCNRRFDVNLL